MLNANWYAILIMILLQKVLILIFDFDSIIYANRASVSIIRNYAKDLSMCTIMESHLNSTTHELSYLNTVLKSMSKYFVYDKKLCFYSGPCSFAMPQKSPWPHHPHHSFKSFLIIILELCTHYYKWMSVDDDLNQLGNLCVMYLSKG